MAKLWYNTLHDSRKTGLDGDGDYMILFATETAVNETRVSFCALRRGEI